MLSTWETMTVQELIENGEAELRTGPFGTQLHASDYASSGTPVINVRNIGFGNIREESLEFIEEETVQRLSSHLLAPGDIVFGRKGAVERHAYIQRRHAHWFQGSDCLRLRIKSERIIPRFVSYYFLTERHKQWMMNQCSHGATMASLNQAVVSRIPLNIPPHDTQHKIVTILSAYDDLIENNTRRIAILEEMAQALYREWFVHFRFPGHEGVRMVESELGPVPEGWEAVKLGDIAQEVRRSIKPDQVGPDTPYVGLEHIPRKSIALTDWGNADQIQSTKLIFKRGEILFGKIRPYFHKVVVAPIKGICSTDIIVILPKKAEHFALVLCCVSSGHFVEYATQTSQGTKMPRADWKVLVKYPVVLSPPVILSQFSEVVQDIVAQIHNQIFRNRNLRQTRDLLLPRLISGELDVSGLEVDIGGLDG
jgi:type I restriction enzyme S subunit